ncbi:MAG TPA: FAD-dependent oxidoreductase, partial [Fodinibius sp.]|nr:FAD-dependent oxidoreductase [Fodinibius sp.]
MINEEFKAQRSVKTEMIDSDLVIVGGGMAGVCAAITAARAGIEVTLVQDRPVLGGNASSEVRLWILGATSHMGNNNRWAREGGVIDEILVENTYRNKEGNPLIFDTILLEKVTEEPHITLLLNTSVYEVTKSSKSTIKSVTGFCSQNSTKYILEAPLFCDASGDGIVAFQAGAPFRMGAEDPGEFDEGFAPDVEDYGELLGHSLYFYTKDTGEPVDFVPPSFALDNADELPRMKNYQLQDEGCKLWWVEYGGRMDTVHQSEEIKWELWKVVYGIWNYVKNSGEFPEANTKTLEWVGMIPGKRESRRFEGDYILTQKDVVEQHEHYDAVAFGGWALDLHPADGVYSDQSSCTQWHSKGVYQIPYRSYYSKSIDNLFLAGRIISTSHVAFGSSRVMATCAHGAQAVGMAAALAADLDLRPADIAKQKYITTLQRELNKRGQSIPRVPLKDKNNLVNNAQISTSNALTLEGLPPDGPWQPLRYSTAQLLPLQAGTSYSFTFAAKAEEVTTLEIALRTSIDPYNYTPEKKLETQHIQLKEGEQVVEVHFEQALDQQQYGFICLMKNETVSIRTSKKRVSGLVTAYNKVNKAVSNFGRQEPPEDIGIDAFEFWCPNRRPDGNNLAFTIAPAIRAFSASNLNNGYTRPNKTVNGWVGHWNEEVSRVSMQWDESQTIS